MKKKGAFKILLIDISIRNLDCVRLIKINISTIYKRYYLLSLLEGMTTKTTARIIYCVVISDAPECPTKPESSIELYFLQTKCSPPFYFKLVLVYLSFLHSNINEITNTYNAWWMSLSNRNMLCTIMNPPPLHRTLRFLK